MKWFILAVAGIIVTFAFVYMRRISAEVPADFKHQLPADTYLPKPGQSQFTIAPELEEPPVRKKEHMHFRSNVLVFDQTLRRKRA